METLLTQAQVRVIIEMLEYQIPVLQQNIQALQSKYAELVNLYNDLTPKRNETESSSD